MTNLLDKFKGCLIGAAIGDAMGAPTEFKSIEAIRQRWGFVDDLEPWGKAAGCWTDDTEMMIALAEALVASPNLTDREATMQCIADAYGEWYQTHDGARSPGGTCLGGAMKLAAGKDWRTTGQPAGPHTGEGCGATMRCHPIGLVYSERLPDLFYLAWSQGYSTHQGPQTNDASVCQCFLISRVLHGDSLEDAVSLLLQNLPGGPPTAQTASMITKACDLSNDLEALLDEWRGWVGDEAFAASLACAARFPDDYAKAVTHAINSPGDSDSLGCICGALMGAKLGLGAIPARWVEMVESREELEQLAEELYRRYVHMNGEAE